MRFWRGVDIIAYRIVKDFASCDSFVPKLILSLSITFNASWLLSLNLLLLLDEEESQQMATGSPLSMLARLYLVVGRADFGFTGAYQKIG